MRLRVIRLARIGTALLAMAKIKGLEKHFARLDPREIQKAAKAGIWASANEIKVEAQLSITRGSVSGAGHKPSKPGEAPNNDTGVLKNNIETISTGPLTAEVHSKAPYAVALEFGTSKMAERPYMRPAAKKIRPQVAANVKVILDTVLRRKG